MFENQSFEGTAKQFMESGVKINGQFVTLIGVSELARHGFLEDAGEGVRTGSRGKTPRKFKAIPREGFKVSFMSMPVDPVPVAKPSKAVDSIVSTLTSSPVTTSMISDTAASVVVNSTDTHTAESDNVDTNASEQDTSTMESAAAVSEEQSPF